jgi:DNA-binding response OmpR family regulator
MPKSAQELKQQAVFWNVMMLLDVSLPDRSGFSFFEELQQRNLNLPTIFLTGSAAEADKLRGLRLGADDYMTKPFSCAELVARIQAVLRRTENMRDQQMTRSTQLIREPFTFCEAKINPTRMEIEFGTKATERIGRKELGILSYLAQNPGTVISRRSLIHAVWGIHADVRSRSLDQYVVRIRLAFMRHNWNIDAFRTVHGVGYIYDPLDQAPSLGTIEPLN